MRIKDMLDTKTIPPPHSPPHTDLIGVIKMRVHAFIFLHYEIDQISFTSLVIKTLRGDFFILPPSLSLT